MKNRFSRNNAFTMVELMIVVGIIAIIAGIGIPSWMRARENAQKTELMSELRTNAEAFQMYASEQNGLPPTASFQQVPAGMTPYMPKKSTWTTSPGGGGYWCWLKLATKVRGYDSFIGVYNSGLSPASVLQIDQTMDDGDLATGAFTTSGVAAGGGPGNSGGTWMFYGVQGYQ